MTAYASCVGCCHWYRRGWASRSRRSRRPGSPRGTRRSSSCTGRWTSRRVRRSCNSSGRRTGWTIRSSCSTARFVLGLLHGELGTSFRSGEPVLGDGVADGSRAATGGRAGWARRPGGAGAPALAGALLRDPLAVVGLALVVLLVLAAFLPSLLSPHDPTAIDATARLAGSSAAHPLGTDEFGRDVLSRLLHAAAGRSASPAWRPRSSWSWVGVGIMRLVDVLLAFPALLLYLAVGTFGPGCATSFWRSSRSPGPRTPGWCVRWSSPRAGATTCWQQWRRAGSGRLMLRHIPPNVVAPVVCSRACRSVG